MVGGRTDHRKIVGGGVRLGQIGACGLWGELGNDCIPLGAVGLEDRQAGATGLAVADDMAPSDPSGPDDQDAAHLRSHLLSPVWPARL